MKTLISGRNMRVITCKKSEILSANLPAGLFVTMAVQVWEKLYLTVMDYTRFSLLITPFLRGLIDAQFETREMQVTLCVPRE
jgi:hypothetical protein